MVIELNITTEAQPKRCVPEVESKISTKNPLKKCNTNGFGFKFDSNQKVKAVVARRRVPSKANKNETLQKSFAKDDSTSVGKVDKLIETKSLRCTNEIDDATNKVSKSTKLLNDNESKLESAGDELILNVYSTPADPTKPVKAKKPLTKFERMRQKQLNKLNQKPLSKEEISKGLRELSENPNKKPHPAEEFFRNQKATARNNPFKTPKPGEETESLSTDTASVTKKPKTSGKATVRQVGLFTEQTQNVVVGQRLVKPVTEKIFSTMKVESIGLHPHAVKNLYDLLSITHLTTVQEKSIPKILEGYDVLVRSQTGSGKTLAYALPIVEKLQSIRPKLNREDGIMAVIIVPTRELAIQTYELLLKLVKPFTWLVPGVLIGGEKRKTEKARLRKGINILIGTPGRLVDHLLHTTTFQMHRVKFLILDEADRLLEMGYERDVKQIVEGIDQQRRQLAESEQSNLEKLQTILLSATLTPAVQQLAGLTLKQPTFIDNSEVEVSKDSTLTGGYNKEAIESTSGLQFDGEDSTGVLTIPTNLILSFVVVPPKLRLVCLSGLLAKEYKDKQKFKALVFMSTMEMVNFHHNLLNEQLTLKILDEDDEDEAANADAVKNSSGGGDTEEPLLKGLRFFRLHGSMSQTERQGVFKGYRECKCGVLLATDVVGRGIDVPEIDLVVQYSPPQKTADFVHRVGRTARAGRSGRAILFLTPNEVQFVRYLENKRIRICQNYMDVYLKALLALDNEANTLQEAASNLQHKFEELISDDKEMYEEACKAFISWTKFYTTFPKELKPIFNVKNAHMGHFAKSFALKDAPTAFARNFSIPKPAPPTNRLTYTERDPEKLKEQKQLRKHRFATTVSNSQRNDHSYGDLNRLVKMLPASRSLTMSEFDSGLPPPKKKQKKSF